MFRLFKYAVVAAVAGTLGFLLGGGSLPEGWDDTPRALSERARDTAEALGGEEAITDALDSVRDRVSDGVRRMAGDRDD